MRMTVSQGVSGIQNGDLSPTMYLYNVGSWIIFNFWTYARAKPIFLPCQLNLVLWEHNRYRQWWEYLICPNTWKLWSQKIASHAEPLQCNSTSILFSHNFLIRKQNMCEWQKSSLQLPTELNSISITWNPNYGIRCPYCQR